MTLQSYTVSVAVLYYTSKQADLYPDQDQTTGTTVGFVMPPVTNPPLNEFIVQITAPSSTGWTGVSLGGSMTMSLLLTMWPYQQQVVVASWTTS